MLNASRIPYVQRKCMAMATYKPPRNGRGKGKGNKGNGSNNDHQSLETKRKILERALDIDCDINVSDYLAAQKRRWGRAYMSIIVEDDEGMATLVMSKPIQEKQGRLAVHSEELRSIEEVVEVMNTYGIGPLIINHIMHFDSLEQPGMGNALVSIPLNIPVTNIRIWEWALEEEEYFTDEDEDDDGGNIPTYTITI